MACYSGEQTLSYYDLYGVSEVDLDLAVNILTSKLSLNFVKRDSVYFGEYYIAGSKKYEHFVLKWNIDVLDGLPDETDFDEYKILLYVNDTCRSEAYRNVLIDSGFSLLRTEHVDDRKSI